MSIDNAEANQEEFNAIINALKRYSSKSDKYIEAKDKLLNNVERFYEGREKIIVGFKNKIFPFNYDEAFEEQVRYEKEEGKIWKEKEEKNIRNENGLINYKKLNELIDLRWRHINNELVKKALSSSESE